MMSPIAQAALPLRVELLGGLRVFCEDQPSALTGSRKARALFAYLLLTNRAHRRERLCDMFWENPDDPRGALRSALSRIRPLVNNSEMTRLEADRERVSLSRIGIEVDYLDIAAELAGPGPFAPEVRARGMELLDETLLAGLDLPECTDYQAWLLAARADADALRKRLVALTDNSANCGGDMQMAPGRSRQRVGHVVSRDGVRIAYGSIGEGPTLVKAANWLNHLELDWESPVWSPLLRDLARDFRVVRHDARGNGLSDWTAPDLSLDAFVADLEAVVEATGCARFPLVGMSQGVAVAIEYAARHPDRVSHLVLWGGYAAGWRVEGDETLRAEREALMTLFRQGWGENEAAYRQLFSRAFMPSATAAELDDFDVLQRATTTSENAIRSLEMFADIDVRHRLAAITAPTLVMHGRSDKRVPFVQGARIAAGIPDAEFITLETQNHFLIGREPAYVEFIAHVREFLAK